MKSAHSFFTYRGTFPTVKSNSRDYSKRAQNNADSELDGLSKFENEVKASHNRKSVIAFEPISTFQ